MGKRNSNNKKMKVLVSFFYLYPHMQSNKKPIALKADKKGARTNPKHASFGWGPAQHAAILIVCKELNSTDDLYEISTKLNNININASPEQVRGHLRTKATLKDLHAEGVPLSLALQTDYRRLFDCTPRGYEPISTEKEGENEKE